MTRDILITAVTVAILSHADPVEALKTSADGHGYPLDQGEAEAIIEEADALAKSF